MLNGLIGPGAARKQMATLQLAINAAKASAGANAFSSATAQVKGAARAASAEVDGLNKTIDRTGAISGSVARSIAVLFAGFGAIQGVREALRTFAEYEQTMASLKGVLEATSAEMIVMNQVALSIGASSRSSTGQAAEGLLILAKAGMSVGEATEALPSVLALATAHALDLGNAADYTANILHQFNLGANETQRVVDVLSTTANKSQADVRDLAEAMKYAGPAAGALGISVEEVAAAAGVLSDRGIKASLAGTNLRGIMTDLINPTEKARKTLEILGLSTADVDVRIHGFTGALKRLADSGADVADLARIFGLLQVSGATALVQNINRINQLTEANRGAAGSTQQLVDIMNDTVMGRFKELLNIIGVAVVQIGQSGLGNSVKELLVQVADGIRLLTGFEDKIKGSSENAEQAASIIKTLGITVGALVAINFAAWTIGVAAALVTAKVNTATWNSQLVLTAALITALMAMDLGMYLYNEFREVREFGDTLASAFRKGQIQAEYIWKSLIEQLKWAWSQFEAWLTNSVVNLSAKLLNNSTIKGMLDRVDKGLGTGLTMMASSVATATNASTSPSYSTYEHEMKQVALEAQRDRELQFEAELATRITQDREAEFGNKDRLTGQSYFDQVGKNIQSLTALLTDQIKVWNDTSEAVTNANQAIGDAGKAQSDYQARVRDITILNEEAHNQALQMVDDLREQAAALQQSQREKNVLVRVTQFQALAEQAYGIEAQRTKDIIEQYTRAVNALEDARADKRFDEYIRRVETERANLVLSTKDRMVAVEVARFHAEAEEAYGRNSERAAEQTARFAEELKKLADAEELRQLADNIGDEFGAAFTDIIFGAKSARDAIKDLTEAVIQLVFQQLVAKQLSNWISGGITTMFMPSAKGNVISGGNVVPFALGGIVSGPTTFPMSGGRTGLVGEAGPEAIMPLSRGRDGKLGVEVTGNASKVINVSMVVNANNPNEFRGSERQLVAGIKHAITRL